MSTIREFGKELRRPFETDSRCFDCVELYHGCNARPENPDSRCADYFPLPDVGVNGQTGQEVPPSRMGDRKEPRVRPATGAPVRVQVQPKNPPSRRRTPAEPKPIEQDPPESSQKTAPEPDAASTPAIGAPPRDPPANQPPKQTRQPSPAANPGPCGEWLCGCGASLRKRQRCCEICRLRRREETIRRRRSRERPSTAVYDVSGVPFTGPGTLSTPCGSGAHN